MRWTKNLWKVHLVDGHWNFFCRDFVPTGEDESEEKLWLVIMTGSPDGIDGSGTKGKELTTSDLHASWFKLLIFLVVVTEEHPPSLSMGCNHQREEKKTKVSVNNFLSSLGWGWTRFFSPQDFSGDRVAVAIAFHSSCHSIHYYDNHIKDLK